MAGQYDILSQLLEASFRDISFPTLMVRAQGGHNVVPHKRVDRNGWRVENTGQNSYVFNFKVPFINSLSRGPNETWSQQLYPDVYLKFISALEDRTTGDFVHPSYGLRRCKVDNWSEDLDPDFRGGPTITATLLETVDAGDAVSIESTSVIPIAAAAAVDLDNFLGTLNPPPDTGTPDGMSLSEFVRKLGAISDQWELQKQKIEGSINRVVKACENLAGKYGYEPGFSDNTTRLISSLHAYRNEGLKQAKPISTYFPPKATTVPALAKQTKNTPEQILKLNPKLLKSPIVPANTPVRYYG